MDGLFTSVRLLSDELGAREFDRREHPEPGMVTAVKARSVIVMNSLGIFSLIAAALQLSVPAYGLRLIRRFGSGRVGWFLVTAFCSLALLHLVERIEANDVGPQMLDMIVAFASGLLLIGMGHVETLCAQ